MKKQSQTQLDWFQTLRFVTPLLGFITLLMMNNIQGKIDDVNKNLSTQIVSVDSKLSAQLSSIDDRLFKHLTNDEIHIPRGQIVTKAEFTMQSEFSDRRSVEITNQIRDVKDTFIQEIRELRKDRK